MKKLIYHIGRLKEDEQENLDFMDGLQRNTEERIELGFVFIKLPVINDAPYRVFNKIKDCLNGRMKTFLDGWDIILWNKNERFTVKIN